jgi:uncharacterized protein
VISAATPVDRLREIKFVRGHDGRSLVYDLERTFLFEVPEELHDLEFGVPDARAETWLREHDLLTDRPRVLPVQEPTAPLPQVTDISIDLPGACNMGCSYCFEKPIHSRIGRMSEETVERTLVFAFAAAKGAPKIVFHFGSGEPLIEFGRLRELTHKAMAMAKERGQNIGFELTTNATLVTPAIAKFLRDHPYNLRVSCDGPAAIHDRNRPMANGRNSYRLVLRGLELLLQVMPERITVNSVFGAGTRLIDLWVWARSLGIRHYHAIKVGAVEGEGLAADNTELALFRQDIEGIADDIHDDLAAGRRPIDYQPLTKVVRRLMLPQPITRFCGVAGSYLGVAADGSIYPCFRHLGLDEYRLGDVRSNVDDQKRRSYRGLEAAEVDKRPGCSTCWGRYICGGGCYADPVVYGVDKTAPVAEHCPYWLAEFEAGIRLYHRLRMSDPASCLALFGDDVDTILDGLSARILERTRTF